ncbi:helix-turn-helix domain-containing protein [Saccharopolyspora phatthalungensis]|uniref:helix-turn-helix domain-containing protein n=1 Tax=Saccharopolyspora phatthalungensis TaxID=664693 RepID=UPI0035E456AB
MSTRNTRTTHRMPPQSRQSTPVSVTDTTKPGVESRPQHGTANSQRTPAPRNTGNRRATAERNETTTPDTSDPHGQLVPLYTPAEAAEILSIKESWLRRKAGTRSIPCTLIGRHLRFSATNLHEIADSGTRPARKRPGRPRTPK